MSELRKYCVLLTTAKSIQFTLYQIDGIDIEPVATFAIGDIKISKDGGAEVNTTNLPVDEGQGYRLILTAAELTSSRIRLFIVDQTATKVWLDIEINIETHGHASAMYVTDFDEVMRGTNNAALASVATETRLAELDAGNIPTDLSGILAKVLHNHYLGPLGYGIYIDSTASNTNTVEGVDGVHGNPVSTLASAKTLATAIGVTVYYVIGHSDFEIDAIYSDWTWYGFGELTHNTINFGSQDVGGNYFYNLALEGTQGGTDRIQAVRCALKDPGAGVSTFHIFAFNCGIVDDITLDTSNDNVFINPFSLVAGNSAPIVRASGASGTMQIRGLKGGIDLRDLSASHNVSLEEVGQVIFDASCNVNANVTIRGIGSLTDNTAGMASLTQEAFINMSKINTEADTALADFFTSSAQLVDDIWDELVTGHTINGSTGKILKGISEGWVADEGSVNDASATTTSFISDLTQATSSFFSDATVVFITGALKGQSRIVSEF